MVFFRKNNDKVKDSWQQQPSLFEDDRAFLQWFDLADSVEDAFARGCRDWHERFASRTWFPSIKKNAVLEIGFGGGRLLAASSKHFKCAYGVDIHNEFDRVAQLLKNRDCGAVNLLRPEAIKSILSASVDFIYSFIVFQHFHALSEVKFYLREIQRSLAPDGVCCIYYGKSEDSRVQTVPFKDFKLRRCSLFMKPKYFRNLIEKNGFRIIEFQDVVKRDMRVESTAGNESAQAMVAFTL